MALAPLKIAARKALEKLGYVVMRNATYDRIISGKAHAPSGQSGTAIVVDPKAAELRKLGVPQEFIEFMRHSRWLVPLPSDQAAVLFSIVQRVLRDAVPGDIVDCGNGNPAMLGFIGVALSFAGACERRLVLLDVSGNPLERAETGLESWGAQHDLLDTPKGRGRAVGHGAMLLPHALQSSNYPADKIAVLRGAPARKLSGQVALLILTSDAYPANRVAVEAVLPSLAANGSVIVTSSLSSISQRDAVNEALAKLGIELSFRRVSASFRFATADRQPPAS